MKTEQGGRRGVPGAFVKRSGLKNLFTGCCILALAASVWHSCAPAGEGGKNSLRSVAGEVSFAAESSADAMNLAADAGSDRLRAASAIVGELVRIDGGLRVARVKNPRVPNPRVKNPRPGTSHDRNTRESGMAGQIGRAGLAIGKSVLMPGEQSGKAVPALNRAKSITGLDFYLYDTREKSALLLASTVMNNAAGAASAGASAGAARNELRKSRSNLDIFESIDYGRPLLRKEYFRGQSILAYYDPLRLPDGSLAAMLKTEMPLKAAAGSFTGGQGEIATAVMDNNARNSRPVLSGLIYGAMTSYSGLQLKPDEKQLEAMAMKIAASGKSERLNFEIPLRDKSGKQRCSALISASPVPALSACIVAAGIENEGAAGFRPADALIPATVIMIFISGMAAIRRRERAAERKAVLLAEVLGGAAARLGIESRDPGPGDIYAAIDKTLSAAAAKDKELALSAAAMGEETAELSAKISSIIAGMEKLAGESTEGAPGVKINLEILREELPKTAVGLARAISLACADLKKLREAADSLANSYKTFESASRHISYTSELSGKIRQAADKAGNIAKKLNSFNVNTEIRTANNVSVEERIRLLMSESRKLALELEIVSVELAHFTREFEAVMSSTAKGLSGISASASADCGVMLMHSVSALKSTDDLARIQKEINSHYQKICSAAEVNTRDEKLKADNIVVFRSIISKLHDIRLEIAGRFSDYAK